MGNIIILLRCARCARVVVELLQTLLEIVTPISIRLNPSFQLKSSECDHDGCRDQEQQGGQDDVILIPLY